MQLNRHKSPRVCAQKCVCLRKCQWRVWKERNKAKRGRPEERDKLRTIGLTVAAVFATATSNVHKLHQMFNDQLELDSLTVVVVDLSDGYLPIWLPSFFPLLLFLLLFTLLPPTLLQLIQLGHLQSSNRFLSSVFSQLLACLPANRFFTR